MNKHTPGPFKKQVFGSVIRITSTITDARVADVPLVTGSQDVPNTNAVADADLLAEAPALLEACKAADRIIVYISNRLATSGRRNESEPCKINADEVKAIREQIQFFRQDACAAIAKAEGRAQ